MQEMRSLRDEIPFTFDRGIAGRHALHIDLGTIGGMTLQIVLPPVDLGRA
jgi:hypothetical protein